MIGILNKDSYAKDYKFTFDEHEQIFESLNEGNKQVKFTNFLPYLMLFFIVSLNNKLEKRLKHYKTILDPNLKNSLYQCF